MKLKLLSLLVALNSLDLLSQQTVTGQIFTHSTTQSNVVLHFYKGKTLTNAIKTDSFGKYILKMDTGYYRLEITQDSKIRMTLKKFRVQNGRNYCNITLNPLIKLPLNPGTHDKSGLGKISGIARMSTGVTYSSSGISGRGSRSDDRLSKERTVPAMAEEESVSVKAEKNENPRSHVLTASYFDDYKNPDYWREPSTSNVSDFWFPEKVKTQCMHWIFRDQSGRPVQNLKVRVQDPNQINMAVSDVNGEVFLNVFENTNIKDFVVFLNGQWQSLSEFEKDGITIKLKVSSSPVRDLEIGFMVDATGSMGDEIQFLKMELVDIISRIQSKMPCLNLKTGSVFYRDDGDEYLYRVMPISDNLASTIQFISDQQAGGGGDFPEAMDIALEQSMMKLQWSEQSSIKLLFMVLDAPPHENEAARNRVLTMTRIAAEKGIRLIPISGSGIDSKTETLLRQLAANTMGRYIYLTDKSGIGAAHVVPKKPINQDTLLNDLIMSTILEYSGQSCEALEKRFKPTEPLVTKDSSMLNEKKDSVYNTEYVINEDWQLEYFPNPSNAGFTIRMSKKADKITICDMNGKAIALITQASEQLFIDTSEWSSGLYMIRAESGNEVITGRLLVIH